MLRGAGRAAALRGQPRSESLGAGSKHGGTRLGAAGRASRRRSRTSLPFPGRRGRTRRTCSPPSPCHPAARRRRQRQRHLLKKERGELGARAGGAGKSRALSGSVAAAPQTGSHASAPAPVPALPLAERGTRLPASSRVRSLAAVPPSPTQSLARRAGSTCSGWHGAAVAHGPRRAPTAARRGARSRGCGWPGPVPPAYSPVWRPRVSSNDSRLSISVPGERKSRDSGGTLSVELGAPPRAPLLPCSPVAVLLDTEGLPCRAWVAPGTFNGRHKGPFVPSPAPVFALPTARGLPRGCPPSGT